MISDTVDFKRPHRNLGPSSDPDYIEQDGVIYNWSESHIRYEYAWWLTSTGEPINDSEHVQNLLRDRPFDKAWLE